MAIVLSTRVIASAVVVTALALVAESTHFEYYIGEQGQSCQEVCDKHGLVCSTKIETGDSLISSRLLEFIALLTMLDLIGGFMTSCVMSVVPVIVTIGIVCMGYCGIPSAVSCSGRHPFVQRLCRCLQKPVYLMGNQGEDCSTVCDRHGLRCSTDYTTLYSSASQFNELGVSCTPDYRYWCMGTSPTLLRI